MEQWRYTSAGLAVGPWVLDVSSAGSNRTTRKSIDHLQHKRMCAASNGPVHLMRLLMHVHSARWLRGLCQMPLTTSSGVTDCCCSLVVYACAVASRPTIPMKLQSICPADRLASPLMTLAALPPGSLIKSHRLSGFSGMFSCGAGSDLDLRDWLRMLGGELYQASNLGGIHGNATPCLVCDVGKGLMINAD